MFKRLASLFTKTKPAPSLKEVLNTQFTEDLVRISNPNLFYSVGLEKIM